MSNIPVGVKSAISTRSVLMWRNSRGAETREVPVVSAQEFFLPFPFPRSRQYRACQHLYGERVSTVLFPPNIFSSRLCIKQVQSTRSISVCVFSSHSLWVPVFTFRYNVSGCTSRGTWRYIQAPSSDVIHHRYIIMSLSPVHTPVLAHGKARASNRFFR